MTTTTTTTTTKTEEEVRPVILGGGIAGLATAVALQHIAGISSQVLERSTLHEFRNVRAGAAAQLGPNGLRALRALGGDELLQKCLAAGSVLKGNVILLPGGPPMVLPDTTEQDTGLPQVLVRWGVLRELLANQIPHDRIATEMGGDVCGYQVNDDDDDGGSSVSLVTTTTTDDDQSSTHHEPANLVVVAEGVRSRFRHLVNHHKNTFGPDEDPEALIDADIKDTGRVNIKAVVPRDLDASLFLPHHTYVYFSRCKSVACFAGPAGDGHTYWAISVADDVTVVEDADDENAAAAAKKITVPFLSEVDQQHDHDDVKSTLLRRLRGLVDVSHLQFVVDLIDETQPETIQVFRSQEAIRIGPSLYDDKDAKAVLVGDAAHAMSASYGQNPNFALEDAAVLACCLRDRSSSSSSGSSVRSALDSYSQQRVTRCLEMQTRSAERAAKAMKGEQAEDVSKWIFRWDID